MISIWSLVLSGLQFHRSHGVAWTKGFNYHHSEQLPSGLVLLTEAGFYSQGSRDLERLTWFRRDKAGFKKVLAFQGMATLDDLPPKVQGDWVRLTTVDEPHVFLVSAGDDTFGREWTWCVKRGLPRLDSCKILALPLRVIDEAIWRSWSVRHPTLLQKRLRKAWPESDDVFSWTAKGKGAMQTVTVNRDTIFTLRRSGDGKWKVIAFRIAHKSS